MTVQEYEAIRRIPTHFAMNPEHDVPGVERVVEKVDPRYWVVEKFGAGEAVALKLDPRARHSEDTRPGAPSRRVAARRAVPRRAFL